MKNRNELNFAEDLVLLCTNAGVGNEDAQKAVRALCRYFGGQMIYVSSRKDNGVSANAIRGVLLDAVNETIADLILKKLMTVSGGLQIYIPLERRAFRKIIALEIFERYGKGVSMNDLARGYNISFTLAYRLWREGQHEKNAKTIPYLPFLELPQ
ncbi:hypothetical protein FACS1894190_15050 [Spirochaetia bacterium]|nr:hypothetical protein FACS1894190_15050 [Spirochaetia bacterium]